MNIYKELRKLAIKMDADVSNAHQIKDLIRAMAAKLDGNSNGAAIADAVKNLTDVHSTADTLRGLTLDVDSGNIGSEILGIPVATIQRGIRIDGDLIRGTSYMAVDFAGFSDDPELQNGNFIAVHASVPGVEDVTIKVHVTNAQIISDVTLDPDGILVFRVTDPKKQKLTFTASKEGYSDFSRTYSLESLRCQTTPTAGFYISGFGEDSTYTIYGKQVKDLEGAIRSTEETISQLSTVYGTLKYVEDFSGFMPAPDNSGYFIAAIISTGSLDDMERFSRPTVTAGFDLDDMQDITSLGAGAFLFVGKITDPRTQKLYVKVEYEDYAPTTRVFSLEGLVLQGQE